MIGNNVYIGPFSKFASVRLFIWLSGKEMYSFFKRISSPIGSYLINDTLDDVINCYLKVKVDLY